MPKFQLTDDERKRWVATAEFLVDQLNTMGCHGYVPGDRDVVFGLEQMRKLEKRSSFPWLAANMVDIETNKPIFGDHVVHEVAGHKVGVFGLTLQATGRVPMGSAGPAWKVLDPITTAKLQIEALQVKGADIIVALTHLTPDTEQKLGETYPSLTAVLGGNGTRLMQHPEKHGSAYVVDGFSKGKYVSALTLHVWKDKSGKGGFVDRFRRGGLDKKLLQLDGRITSYERIVERKAAEAAEAAAAGTKPATHANKRAVGVDFYEKQLVKYRTEKQLLEMELEELKAVDPTANYISFELIALGRDVVDEPKTLSAIEAFRQKVPAPGKKSPAPGSKRR